MVGWERIQISGQKVPTNYLNFSKVPILMLLTSNGHRWLVAIILAVVSAVRVLAVGAAVTELVVLQELEKMPDSSSDTKITTGYDRKHQSLILKAQ